jgi:ketol-acid reductoisomerase
MRDESPHLEGPVVIFGFGAQGRAQALNLKDSGMDPIICLRGSSRRMEEVKACGLRFMTDARAAAGLARVASMLLPDGLQKALYDEALKDALPKGAAIVFAHGISIHSGMIRPREDLDILLAAPLCHGDALRENFTSGKAAACMLAVSQDASGHAADIALDYARCISRSGPFIKSTFKEEVEMDLFVEQVLLCGGLAELIRSAFETLVDAGFNEEASYFCCVKELLPIARLVDTYGIDGMLTRISDTARFGAVTRGKRVISEQTRAELEAILSEIRSGQFIAELRREVELGYKTSAEEMTKSRDHPLELIGRRLGGSGPSGS